MKIDRWRNGILLCTIVGFSAGYALPGLIMLLVVSTVEAGARSWHWVPTALDRPLLGLVLVSLASGIASEWRTVSTTLAALLALTLAISVRSVAAYVRGNPGRTVHLLLLWVAGGLLAAVKELAETLPQNLFMPYGPVTQQNATGTTLTVATILTLGMLMGSTSRGRWWLAAIPLLIAGLVATWSRAAWLGAAAGVVTLLLVGGSARARTTLALASAGLIIAALAIVPRLPTLPAAAGKGQSLGSLGTRLVIWRTVPRIVAAHPLLGTGYGTFVNAYPRYGPPNAPEPNPPFAHNLFLNFAAETGLLGLAAVVVLCWTGLAAMWRWRLRSPPASEARTAATAILAATVALLVNQLFDGTVMSVHYGFGFFALLTLGAAGSRYLVPANDVTP